MIEHQELPLKFSLFFGLLAGLASLTLLKDSGLTFSLSWHWPVSVAAVTAVIASLHLLLGKTLYSRMWIVPAVSFMGSFLWLVGAEAYALHQVPLFPFFPYSIQPVSAMNSSPQTGGHLMRSRATLLMDL